MFVITDTNMYIYICIYTYIYIYKHERVHTYIHEAYQERGWGRGYGVTVDTVEIYKVTTIDKKYQGCFEKAKFG